MWSLLPLLIASLLVSLTGGHVEFVPLDRREAYEYRVGISRARESRPSPPPVNGNHRWSAVQQSTTPLPTPPKHVWLPDSRVYSVQRVADDGSSQRNRHSQWPLVDSRIPPSDDRKYPQYPPYYEMFIPHDYDLPEYIGKL